MASRRRWWLGRTRSPSGRRSRSWASLNEQINLLQEQVEAHFGRHPDWEIYTSQPGLGQILGARVLAEFGDDPTRYGDTRARKNYAGTSPITRQSGKKKGVLARDAHNDPMAGRPGRAGVRRAEPAHPARGPTTTSNATAVWATGPPCVSSPTAWSGSCTAALRPAPATTRPRPGHHAQQDQQVAA